MSFAEIPAQNSRDEVVGRFSQYKPSAEALADSAETRERFENLADYLWRTLPAGREKSLALTNLEEAMMFSNKATFRHKQEGEAK